MSPKAFMPRSLQLPDGLYDASIYGDRDYGEHLQYLQFQMNDGTAHISDHPTNDTVSLGSFTIQEWEKFCSTPASDLTFREVNRKAYKADMDHDRIWLTISNRNMLQCLGYNTSDEVSVFVCATRARMKLENLAHIAGCIAAIKVNTCAWHG